MGTSDSIVIQSPTSFVGSARRIWRLTDVNNKILKLLLMPVAALLVVIAWIPVALYTILFGLLLVPWRLLRRGSRKRKQENLRHKEMMDAVAQNQK